MIEEKKELSDLEFKKLITLIHPVPLNQDGDCPHIQWMGEDLAPLSRCWRI